MDADNQPKKTPLAGELPKEPETVKPTIVDLPGKDLSHLPSEVQLSINMDKKKNDTAATPTNSTNNKVLSSVLKKDFSKKFFKITLGFFVVFVLCFLAFLLISAARLDTKIIKITLFGTVTDLISGDPVENANIIINEEAMATTDTNGQYSISGLEHGPVQVTVKADGYDDLTEEVTVSRVLLDYTTKKDFQLKSSLTGVLSGKFIPNNGHRFIDDTLMIGEKTYKINEDGTFQIPNIQVGEAQFKFISRSFKDISQQINVAAGLNQIPEITLEPAGDIVGELKSYIKEDLVLNAKFFVENILQDQVDIAEDGKFAVKELDVDRNYKIRVTADGYKSRDYDILIRQGENQLFNFRLVEDGIAIYAARTGTATNSPIKLFSSDFDGANRNTVNEDSKIDVLSKFYSIEDQKLYYQSTAEGNLNLPYSYNLDTKELSKLTFTTTDLKTITANFVAKKLLNIYQVNQTGGARYGLQLFDIDGNNKQDIKFIEQPSIRFDQYKVSNNGRIVAYSYTISNNTELYLFNTASAETKLAMSGSNIKIYDISQDGNLLLTSRRNQNTGLVDLVLFNYATNDLRTLKENLKGNDYQFVKGDNNKLIFFEERESSWNIYTFTLDRSQEERITSLTPDYEIKDIYQESNLLFYLTNRGLLVLDISKPKNFKLVSDAVLDYTTL